HMGMRLRVATLFAIMVVGLTSYAQEKMTVIGIVVDSLDRSPLPGVTVTVQGATTSTKTNEAGEYSVDAPPNATLIFAYLGYATVHRPVAGNSRIDVLLSSSSQGLDEV